MSHTVFNSTAMAITHDSALILVEYVECCRADFGRAEKSSLINIIDVIACLAFEMSQSCDFQFNYNGDDAHTAAGG